MWDEIEQLVQCRFEAGRGWDVWNGLARMFGLPQYDARKLDHETPTTSLVSAHTGLPAKCHLCNKTDGWTLEGNKWVCDHTRDFDLADWVEYVPIRIVSDVDFNDFYEAIG